MCATTSEEGFVPGWAGAERGRTPSAGKQMSFPSPTVCLSEGMWGAAGLGQQLGFLKPKAKLGVKHP